MSYVWMLQRGHNDDGCAWASTLCKYDLWKGRFMYGGVRSIFLLPLVARCLETIDVCIWRMFVFMSVVVTVWGMWGNLLLKILHFEHWSVEVCSIFVYMM